MYCILLFFKDVECIFFTLRYILYDERKVLGVLILGNENEIYVYVPFLSLYCKKEEGEEKRDKEKKEKKKEKEKREKK